MWLTWSAELEEVGIELRVTVILASSCLIADVMEYAGSLEWEKMMTFQEGESIMDLMILLWHCISIQRKAPSLRSIPAQHGLYQSGTATHPAKCYQIFHTSDPRARKNYIIQIIFRPHTLLYASARSFRFIHFNLSIKGWFGLQLHTWHWHSSSNAVRA